MGSIVGVDRTLVKGVRSRGEPMEPECRRLLRPGVPTSRLERSNGCPKSRTGAVKPGQEATCRQAWAAQVVYVSPVALLGSPVTWAGSARSQRGSSSAFFHVALPAGGRPAHHRHGASTLLGFLVPGENPALAQHDPPGLTPPALPQNRGGQSGRETGARRVPLG